MTIEHVEGEDGSLGEHVSITIPQPTEEEIRMKYLTDLESIASLTFKEKQLWFLDRMSELQRPWSEGCIRLDVRFSRSHLLNNFYTNIDMYLIDVTIY